MTHDVVLSINASLGEEAARAEPGDLEAKVKASMRGVLQGNWMETSDDALFRAGVAGAMLAIDSDSDDGQRLRRSIDFLRKFSAWMNAAKEGVAGDLPPVDDDILPLPKWWNELKDT